MADDSINYGAHAADTAIDYGAHGSTEQPGRIEQIKTSLKNQAKGIFDQLSTLVAGDIAPGQGPADVIANSERAQGIPKDAGKQYSEQWEKAKAAYKAGDYLKALGHALPIIGPVMDKVQAGRSWEAGTDIAALPAAIALTKGAPVAGDVALTAAKAAARGGVKALAKVPEIPGVAQDLAGVVAPPVAHGMRLVNRATNAARKVDKIIPPAETPVSRVANAFDPATARIQSPPVDPRVARVADAFNPETAWPADTEGIPPAGMAPQQPVPRGTPADVEPTMIPRGTTAEIPPGGGLPSEVQARASAAGMQSGLQPIPPEPQPQMQGPIAYEASVNPDVARGLTEGTQRVGKNGGSQTLRQVPIEHIEGDPGNTIYPERVDEYQKNGYAVHPELRTNPEGGFTINEGHHRILADVRNGKDSILAWTPEDVQADRIKEITRPDTVSETMRQLPPQMRGAAADANYRAIKEGAPAADAAETYKAAAQANKMETLGKHLLESGFTPQELREFPPDKLKAGLEQRVKNLGINQTGKISDKTISDTIAWMEQEIKRRTP